MAHRLAIIPAGAVGSAGQARRLVAAIQARPSGTLPAAIGEVLGALAGSGAADVSAGACMDSRGMLISIGHPEVSVLEPLLVLAKDHDLAVYDIVLSRLYDPTQCVEVDVLLPELRLPYVTRDLLVDLVAHPQWPQPSAPYVILARSGEDFIQAWLTDDGTYQLEYREGGAEFHFVYRTRGALEVAEVMWAWAIDDVRWRGAVDWTFLDISRCAVPAIPATSEGPADPWAGWPLAWSE